MTTVIKILPLIFAFSITAYPSFAWGEGECPFSKKNKANQEAKTEQLEKVKSSNQ